MAAHEKIIYVEFPAKDLPATERFFSAVFGWTFEQFGPEYIAFTNQGLDGGFYLSDKVSSAENGSALIVFYSDDLGETLAKIEQAGGIVLKPIFDFPGGQRFHFSDPSGNEYAVWANKN